MTTEINACDRCGRLGVLGVEHFPEFDVPDEFDYLCRDCADEVNTHSIEDMSDAALIAAIMDHSHGYASPHHAEQHVEAYHDGEKFAFCERAVSCFPVDPTEHSDEELETFTGMNPGDLERLLEHARRHWRRMSDEKQEKLHKFAREWREVEEPGEISSISLQYPTMGL